jgi:hypothetical protein
MGNDADNKAERILFKNQGWTNESSLHAPLLSTAIVSAHRRKERTGPGAEA